MESAPNLSRLSSEVRELEWVLREGISHFGYILVNKVFLKYIFGYNLSINLRMFMLCVFWGPLGPLSPGLPGTSDIFNDIRKWLRHDSPSPTPIVRAKSLVRLLVYFVPGLWPTLDFDHFAYWVFMSLAPAASMIYGYFLTTRLALDPKLRQSVMQWAEWVLEERYVIFPYGVVSYVLLLQGRTFPFAIFLASSDLLQSYWSSMSDRSIIITQVCLAGPCVLLYSLVVFPFAPVWLFRQTFKIPYWWASWQVKKIWRTFSQKPSVWQEGDKVWQESDTVWQQSDRYMYQPLQSGQIRILEVTRHSSTGELTCNLRHAVLEEADSYDAVSYTWGPPEDRTHRICIDRKWLDIKKNAYELLQDRARTFETRKVWIDCICINQADDNEKSIQVPLMAEIYRRADRTIVWLGQSPDAEQAFSLLLDLLERPNYIPNDAPDAIKGLLENSTVSVKSRAQRFAYFEHLDQRFAALARLLKHEYFRRVWIIQEIAFSKTIHIQSGGSWIEWKDFARAIRLFGDPETYTLVGREELYKHIKEPCGLGEIINLDITRTREQVGGERPPLCNLLANLWMAKATDPRDMIYGLLNLSREAGLAEFAPDYAQKNWSDLYIAVAGLFLKRDELQEILGVAGIGYKEEIRTMPSWTPDWTSVPLIPPLRRPQSTKPYNACNSKPSKFNLLNPKTLSARGILVNTIAETTLEHFAAVNLSNEKIKVARVKQMFREIEAQSLVEKLPPTYVDGTDREEAFWRTLIGDTGMSSLPGVGMEQLAALGLPAHGNGFIQERPAPAEYYALFKQDQRIQSILRELGLTSPQVLLEKHTTPAPLPTGKTKADRLHLVRELQNASDDSRYADSFIHSASGRKFAITENKYMALVPPHAKAGDHICVFFGLDVPFLVRETGSVGGETIYDLVGECYVHGIMDGEAVISGEGMEVDFRIQ